MLLEVASQLALAVERSFAEPEDAAMEAVRAMMNATRSANGFLVLALRQRGRPRQNTRDAMLGFRAVFYRRAIPPPAATAALIAEKLETRRYFQDPLSQELVRNSRRPWAARLWDRADPETIRAFLRNPVPHALGLKDRLYATTPLGPEAFTVVCLDRTQKMRRYLERDVEVLLGLMQMLEPCLQRLAEHHGVFAGRERLSPREVEVYRLLRDGLTEKELAQVTGLSVHTAHDLVREILRKLGMSGRVALMRWALRPRCPTEREPSPLKRARRAQGSPASRANVSGRTPS